MQLTEKIYGYPWQGMGNNCNTFLYAGEKTILIDPGHINNEFRENCLVLLLSEMEADGFTPEKVDLIVCTHGHPDHCESATVFREKYNTRLAMHQAEEEHMRSMARFLEQMIGQSPAPPVIDLYLQEGELELGAGEKKDTIFLYYTPGHSPGSLSLYFPEEKSLITGDVVFSGSIGRTDFPDGSMELMGRSVDRLSRINGLEWLLPGHMQLVKGEAAIQKNFAMIKRMFF